MESKGQTAGQRESLTFRQPVWEIPAFAVLGAFFLFGLFLVCRDPAVLSPKGLLILALGLTATMVVGFVVMRSWLAAFDCTLTPTHLVAVHRFQRHRIELPWDSIIRVRRLRPWQGPLVSRIETADGRALMVDITLADYARFLEELKVRTPNCREFDPYRSDFDRFRWLRR